MADVAGSATANVTLYDEAGAQLGTGGNPLVSKLSASSDVIGFVSPSVSKKVGEGKFFVAGAAIQVPALANAGAAFRLSNPVGSGVNLYVVRLTMYSSVEQQVRYRAGATLDSPTEIVPRNLIVGGGQTPKFSVQSSGLQPTDGELWGNESRVFANGMLELELPPLVLAPGASFVMYGSATGSQITTVNVYLYQE